MPCKVPYLWLLGAVALYSSFSQGASADLCSLGFAKLKDDYNFYKLYRGNLTAKLSEQDYAIFEKVRLDPEAELTPEEVSHLQGAGLGKSLDRYRATSQFVRQVNHVVALSARSKPLNLRSPDYVHFMQRWGTKILSSGLPIGPEATARKIFRKALYNPTSSLSPKDADFLRTWNLTDDYERLQRELETQRAGFLRLDRISTVENRIAWGLKGSAAVAAAVLGQTEHKEMSIAEGFDQNNPNAMQPEGTVELLLPKAPNPAVLMVDGLGFVFDPLEVKILKGDEAYNEISSLYQLNKIDHVRIRFRASEEEHDALIDKLVNYVSRTKMKDRKKVLSKRVYFDLPGGEAFRILRTQFHLPPFPVANKNSEFLVDYFKMLKMIPLGEKESRVSEVYRVESNTSSSEVSSAEEMARSAFNALALSSVFGRFPKLSLSLVGYDFLGSTKIEIDQKLGEKK
jgi:hypothetical protein